VKGITNVAGAGMRRSGAPVSDHLSRRGRAAGRAQSVRLKAPTVGTLQTLPACEPDDHAASAGKVYGFSLHAGVAARAGERNKLERLCDGGRAVTSVGQPLRKSAWR